MPCVLVNGLLRVWWSSSTVLVVFPVSSCSASALRGVLLMLLSDLSTLVDEDWPMTLGGPVPSCPGLEARLCPRVVLARDDRSRLSTQSAGVDGEQVSVADGGGGSSSPILSSQASLTLPNYQEYSYLTDILSAQRSLDRKYYTADKLSSRSSLDQCLSHAFKRIVSCLERTGHLVDDLSGGREGRFSTRLNRRPSWPAQNGRPRFR